MTPDGSSLPPALFHSYHDSPVGLIEIVAVTDGLCAVTLGAEWRENCESNQITQDCAVQLNEYFEGKRQKFEIPMEAGGTEFEQAVWQELTQIPYAATCSYLDIAHRMKNPGAIRAVGRANGKNPIAIVVPCHRVIGSDGKLTGYSGELWRKRWLLDHEAKVAGMLLF